MKTSALPQSKFIFYHLSFHSPLIRFLRNCKKVTFIPMHSRAASLRSTRRVHGMQGHLASVATWLKFLPLPALRFQSGSFLGEYSFPGRFFRGTTIFSDSPFRRQGLPLFPPNPPRQPPLWGSSINNSVPFGDPRSTINNPQFSTPSPLGINNPQQRPLWGSSFSSFSVFIPAC